MLKEYVVLDIETNGFYFEFFHEVIEVAAIKVKDGEIVEIFHEYIKPWIKVPKEIEELTGITNEFLNNKPNRWEVLPKLRRFLGNNTVVAYNSVFDVDFLNHWFLELKLDPVLNSVCAYNTFKNLTGKKKDAKLINAVEYYNLSLENAHSAIDDTKATVEVFKKELEDIDKIIKASIIPLRNKYLEVENIINNKDNKEDFIKSLESISDYFGVDEIINFVNSSTFNKEEAIIMLNESRVIEEENIKTKQYEKYLSSCNRSFYDVVLRNKKRILNSSNNKAVKSELLKAEKEYGSRNKIKTQEDKNIVASYFSEGQMFPVISAMTMFDEKSIEDFFIEWVNDRNISKYPFLKDKKIVDNVLSLLSYVDSLEEVYKLHKEIFAKKNQDPETVPVNTFIYRLVNKIHAKEKTELSDAYSLDDFRIYFDSGKTLSEIINENSSIKLNELMKLFAEWLVENESNREIYRSYISDNILSLEELKIISSDGLDYFLSKNPYVDKKKALLTSVLYEYNFFKI